jgi:glutamyl-tRNA reductase
MTLKMHLVVIGLNHKTAPVAIREKFAVSTEDISKALERIDDYPSIDGAVILSTCNRSEVYAVVDKKENVSEVKKFFFSLTAMPEINAKYFYCFTERDCIYHLLKVAASLDSLIIGEGQILSQVKKAYEIAHSCQATDAILNMLFNKAIATGKRVRTETHIAYNPVSVSYAAVKLAQSIFSSFTDRGILIYGAGKMAKLTAQHLKSNGAGNIYVANRHIEKAVDLAESVNGQAMYYADIPNIINDVDFIITSTGAPHYMIDVPTMKEFMETRQGRPLFIIDIAVPRDVDPDVAEISGVTLYNIDELEAVVHDNKLGREREAAIAGEIVNAETDNMLDRFKYLSMRPIMLRLSRKAEIIRQRELKRALTKLPDISGEEYKIIENMSHMIIRKILRTPMAQATLAAGTVNERAYSEAMAEIFNLGQNKETQKYEG